MTPRTWTLGPIPALAVALLLMALPGCFGASNDKGDTPAAIITPKPGTTEDANTAGNRKTDLPPAIRPDVKSEGSAGNPVP